MTTETFAQSTDRPPVALVTLHGGPHGYQWILTHCPYCGGEHRHGGGDLNGDPRTLLGVRVAHCRDPRQRGRYLLIEATRAEGGAR